MEMYNIKGKNETEIKQHINSEHEHEPPNDQSNSEYDEKVKLMKDYEEMDYKMEKKKPEEDLAIPKITTEMVIQSNSVNNIKEIFEEIKIEVKNPEEDITVPRIKRHI